MSIDLDKIRADIEAASLDGPKAIEAFKNSFLGRKNGIITGLFGEMRNVAPEARKDFGQKINGLKQLAEARLSEGDSGASGGTGLDDSLDFTLPGRPSQQGSLHPLRQTLDEVLSFFKRFGFDIEEGPEIEDDWHNFTALNFPPDHPARDMQDTLFVEAPNEDHGGVVLRTHTSPVQIRIMENSEPPLRIVVPGRVYRNEALSYKSYCLFHQVEGLYIDEGVSFADLKQMLFLFARHMFGDDVKMRFRPSFFPFTEPSAEVDIWWANKDNPEEGRWMEILGCGMVDPNLLINVGMDPEKYTGFAWGMGIERICMLRHGIKDIRLFYENDLRFLKQF